MLKFKGNKPLKTLIKQARAQGVAVDDYNYRKAGFDFVAFGVAHRTLQRSDGTPFVPANGRGCVMYNTANGRFYGATDTGVKFNSDSTKHDKEPWMQALLRFFYVEK